MLKDRFVVNSTTSRAGLLQHPGLVRPAARLRSDAGRSDSIILASERRLIIYISGFPQTPPYRYHNSGEVFIYL